MPCRDDERLRLWTTSRQSSLPAARKLPSSPLSSEISDGIRLEEIPGRHDNETGCPYRDNLCRCHARMFRGANRFGDLPRIRMTAWVPVKDSQATGFRFHWDLEFG